MIAKATVAGIATMAIPLLVLFGLVAVAAGAASGSAAAAGHATFNPSVEAIDDIAPGLIDLYVRAATSCVGLPWQVVAAIAKVESNHGRHGGSTITPTGAVVPPIIGIALDGTGGTSAISDTDGGRLAGDSVWDRAVGPFQFIPSSWAIFGQDADNDGARNPQNILDAAAAAVAHLCPTGAITDLEAAIFAYNHSDAYVTAVLDWARRYTGPLASVGPVIEGYAFPLPPAYATRAVVTRSHQDYPAIDVATPSGTLTYAMVAGTVTAALGDVGVYVPGGSGRCGNTIVIAGADGATYTYCHLSAVFVAPGQSAVAGSPIGLTGGAPGAPGAGNTTGPHLHLAIRVYGQSVCPQPLLLALVLGQPLPPTAAPASGCTTPGQATDWPTWLAAIDWS